MNTLADDLQTEPPLSPVDPCEPSADDPRAGHDPVRVRSHEASGLVEFRCARCGARWAE